MNFPLLSNSNYPSPLPPYYTDIHELVDRLKADWQMDVQMDTVSEKQIEGPTNILTEQQTDRQTITTSLRFVKKAAKKTTLIANQRTGLVACCHSLCLFYQYMVVSVFGVDRTA
jgi:hypothetical protein